VASTIPRDNVAIDVPILIVGAGPVGLALALDLGWRGIECLLVERSLDRRADIDAVPRAAAIAPRTMEFCRRWGFAERITNAGFPTNHPFNIVFCTSLDGYTVCVQEFDSMDDRQPLAVSPEFRERCPQMWFDPILAQEAARYTEIGRLDGWQLDSFRDEATHVTAMLSSVTDGAQREIRCRYLVACDGAASDVRAQLGVAAEGPGKLSDSLVVVLQTASFLKHHDKGPAERYLFLDETGRWAELSVVDGRERWRFGLTWASAEVSSDRSKVEAALRRALGPNVEYEILNIARWRRRDSVAERFKIGNVFLAGDAAHVIPPNLGLGMNTGVADSVDLGWKLAATLQGWGGEALLESYEAERRPAALRNAAASTRAYRVSQDAMTGHPDITESGERGEQARASVAEHLQRELSAGWQTLNLQLGYRYDDSPICIPDGTPAPAGDDDFGTYHQTARPGARAPHVWLGKDRSTIDLFGRGFVLLRLASTDLDVSELLAAAQSQGVPFELVDLDNPEVLAAYQRRLVLVRPDGHVAWRSDEPPADPNDLIKCIRGANVPAAAAAGS
jgi:2-polyprenyl-6-methoxyphenol hydroxylase-like FAD-dependent oxidoreductase